MVYDVSYSYKDNVIGDLNLGCYLLSWRSKVFDKIGVFKVFGSLFFEERVVFFVFLELIVDGDGVFMDSIFDVIL